jgi:DNA polymerase III subunit delta'
MSGVFTRLVGQEAVEAELLAAARAARGGPAHNDSRDGTMTHAWLITGPPGSGRSVAALCFAAALQCTGDFDAGGPGCGRCRACTTTMAGTHADVRRVIPEGLSIGVDEMRAIVQIASRRPTTGHRQIVLIEDADRLTVPRTLCSRLSKNRRRQRCSSFARRRWIPRTSWSRCGAGAGMSRW